MFKDEVTAVGNAAKGKLNLLENNFAGYVLMSILAGMYIALGSILMHFRRSLHAESSFLSAFAL